MIFHSYGYIRTTTQLPSTYDHFHGARNKARYGMSPANKDYDGDDNETESSCVQSGVDNRLQRVSVTRVALGVSGHISNCNARFRRAVATRNIVRSHPIAVDANTTPIQSTNIPTHQSFSHSE